MTNSAPVGARLDALGSSWAIWRLIVLVSMGGFFEFYDLMMTAYISPGLARAGIFHLGAEGLFGLSDQGTFAAATFLGLFIGTLGFARVADRFGRRSIFTFSLLWYSAASAMMALAHSAAAIDVWRLTAGIGIGVELVVIDSYIAELAPPTMRGRAFAINQAIQFLAVPTVAFACWILVPRAPLGIAGWRWVVLAGSTGALAVWLIRRRLPESPRWLETRGRGVQATEILGRLGQIAPSELAQSPTLEEGSAVRAAMPAGPGMFSRPYRRRTTMLVILNVFQAIGFYGFGNWAPSLIAAQGHALVASLGYGFVIALAYPIGPLLCVAIADRIERKLQIIIAAVATAWIGLLFARQTAPWALIILGIGLTFSNNLLSWAYHAYQTELFPTRMRAAAVGFVYSWSRLSTVLSSLVIAALLTAGGTTAVFAFIAAAMAIVIVAVGALGPRTVGAGLDDLSP
ncbi:MAG TPA: MFS transporter [Caulobacteraceae bacterium]